MARKFIIVFIIELVMMLTVRPNCIKFTRLDINKGFVTPNKNVLSFELFH